MSQPLPGRPATEPVAVIAELISAVEPAMSPDQVAAAIAEVVPRRNDQRALAEALEAEPSLLTSGRPAGPVTIGRLVQALSSRGGQHVALPRCAECDVPRILTGRSGELRICYLCSARRTAAEHPCAGCGENRAVAYRDQSGRPRCYRCPPKDDRDPLEVICRAVRLADPDLSTEKVIEAVRQVAAGAAQQRKLGWALEASPDLLTGSGAHGTPKVIFLIEALVAGGSTGVVRPSCPYCDQVAPLKFTREQLRCCRRCYDQSRLAECARCHRPKPTNGRTKDGESVCESCYRSDPANHGLCSSCGRVRYVTDGAGTGPLCKVCRLALKEKVVCSSCGKLKICHRVESGSPRCEACVDRLRPHQACAECGKLRRVEGRSADGGPLCTTCAVIKRNLPCDDCGKPRRIMGSAADGRSLCYVCYPKDPASERTCERCGIHERLHRRGLCRACAAADLLTERLRTADGVVRPEAEPVYRALLDTDPDALLVWLSKPTAKTMLSALAHGTGPITHEVLDELPHPVAIGHLRSILVYSGALPERDEHLARLEKQVKEALGEIDEVEDRKLVRAFATWHHLRRLRGRRQPTTRNASYYAWLEIHAAIEFLAWLRSRDRSAETCTQADVDLWLERGGRVSYDARAFLTWAVASRHAHNVKIPHSPHERRLEPLPTEEYWSLARRFLHDEQIALADRVAGLLVVLLAQQLSTIVTLTTDDVGRTGDTVTLRLGAQPVELPPPLDALVLRYLEKRAGYSALGHGKPTPWLFPGGHAGRPLSMYRLMMRLQRYDVRTNPTRNAALIDLAAKMPAVVLSNLLGIHINTATRWNREAGATNARYAAKLLARRREHSRATFT